MTEQNANAELNAVTTVIEALITKKTVEGKPDAAIFTNKRFDGSHHGHLHDLFVEMLTRLADPVNPYSAKIELTVVREADGTR